MAEQETLSQIAERVINALVESRGTDDVGEGDQWQAGRLPECEDDYVYDLAVEVRRLRERACTWWQIANDLRLPGWGNSAVSGKAGAAFARRLWREAWGKTYRRIERDEPATEAAVEIPPSWFEPDVLERRVIKEILGQEIEWYTALVTSGGLLRSRQTAYVHHDQRKVFVKDGAKGRYVEFYEQPDPSQLTVDPQRALAKGGPLRSVYLARITKVGA
jgi:hypothetical protein